jgi:hypothetical protein
MATTSTAEAPPTGANGNAWLPISEAAARLGVSQDAIRRRLKAGALHGKREAMPQGFRWLVLLEGGDAAEVAQGGATRDLGGTPPNGGPPGGAQVAELATARAQEMAAYTERLLRPYVEKIEAQATQIGRLENEVEHLHAQLAAVTPAPVTNGIAHEPHGQAGPPVADAEDSASPPETQDDDAPRPAERRRWWPRLIAWLGGAQSP